MARKYNPQTIEVLETLAGSVSNEASQLYKRHGNGMVYKDFYNLLFRLADLGLAEKSKEKGGLKLKITAEGQKLLTRQKPKADGVWKLVIFDIPEKHKKVRSILRAKLKQLHFKKWQNSIWVSPFALDDEIENEMLELGKKFFIRLIKTKEINHTEDLKKLFNI